MSKTSQKAGVAYHKASKALDDISKIRQTMYRDSVGKVFLGFFVLIGTGVYDLFAPILEAQYSPGFGRQQIFLTLCGIGLILWGIKGLSPKGER